MSDFAFNIHEKILLSSYSASRIGEFVKDWGTKFMVIMDPVLTQVDTGSKITKPLTDRKLDYFVFSNIEKHADTKTVDSVLKLTRQAHIDGIIGVGGSKVINLARAVAALYNETRDTYTAIEKNDITCEPLPLVCVPTTFRDRFVFTQKVPLIDSRNSQISLLQVQKDLGEAVIFDPNLLLSLSENQCSSMLLETLGIAIEAYISPKANFFSDMAVEKAFELLGLASNGTASLEVTTPKEELLCQGGLMASLASSTSSLGISSLLAMCISARYGITSSLAAAIILPHVLDDASKFKIAKLARISHLLKTTTDDATDEKAAADLSIFIRQTLAKANLPSRLKDLSISIEQLSLSAEDAGKLEFINSLPKSTTTDDLFTLIKLAY